MSGTGATQEASADRRSRLLMRVGLSVGAVALLAAAAWGGLSLASGGRAGADLDRALELLAKADKVVLAVDAVVQAKIEPGLAEEARARAEDVPTAVKDLEDAAALLEGVDGKVRGREAELAAVAAEAAQGRLEMMRAADRLLDANAKAAKALGYAGDGWVFMGEAEKLGDQAVSEYNKLTKAGVTSSQRTNERAIERVKEARALFSQAASAFPEADLATYVSYSDEKLAVLESSGRIDELWLAGKSAEANAEVQKYNNLDGLATTRANQLKAPSAAIAEGFEKVTRTDADRYYQGRDKAAKADSREAQLQGDDRGVRWEVLVGMVVARGHRAARVRLHGVARSRSGCSAARCTS